MADEFQAVVVPPSQDVSSAPTPLVPPAHHSPLEKPEAPLERPPRTENIAATPPPRQIVSSCEPRNDSLGGFELGVGSPPPRTFAAVSDLVGEVFSYLTTQEVRASQLVCKRWRHVGTESLPPHRKTIAVEGRSFQTLSEFEWHFFGLNLLFLLLPILATPLIYLSGLGKDAAVNYANYTPLTAWLIVCVVAGQLWFIVLVCVTYLKLRSRIHSIYQRLRARAGIHIILHVFTCLFLYTAIVLSASMVYHNHAGSAFMNDVRYMVAECPRPRTSRVPTYVTFSEPGNMWNVIAMKEFRIYGSFSSCDAQYSLIAYSGSVYPASCGPEWAGRRIPPNTTVYCNTTIDPNCVEPPYYEYIVMALNFNPRQRNFSFDANTTLQVVTDTPTLQNDGVGGKQGVNRGAAAHKWFASSVEWNRWRIPLVTSLPAPIDVHAYAVWLPPTVTLGTYFLFAFPHAAWIIYSLTLGRYGKGRQLQQVTVYHGTVTIENLPAEGADADMDMQSISQREAQ